MLYGLESDAMVAVFLLLDSYDNKANSSTLETPIDETTSSSTFVKYLSRVSRSTAELESFHNHILMYASKRFSFSPPVYAARVMLAGLDYNHHVHRPARRKADGSIQYGKVYNKKSRKWSLYKLKEEKDYRYIIDLQGEILQENLSGFGGFCWVSLHQPTRSCCRLN